MIGQCKGSAKDSPSKEITIHLIILFEQDLGQLKNRS